MTEETMAALRALANRWAMRARDYARTAKESGASESQAAYDRGYAEAYYRAATELAELLKEQPAGQPAGQPAQPASRPVSSAPAAGASPQRQPAPVPPAPPAQPVVTYAAVPLGEVYSILEFAGCMAREVIPNKDGTFHAIFSRWENMMPHERLERIQRSDPRMIILSNGKLESHDHYVDFAFKEA